nr:response regulator [Lunatimonas salinarum]
MIDDDPIVILLQRKLMEKAGYIGEIQAFGEGEKALSYLKQNSKGDQRYLIFLDINMPGMSGWEFLDQLIASNIESSFSVVIITSSIEQAEQLKSEEYEQIIDFWIKPFSVESFQKLKQKSQLEGFYS